MSTEFQKMWKRTCLVGPPGIATKEAIKYLKIIPDKHSIDSIKKSSNGKARIIKVLQSET